MIKVANNIQAMLIKGAENNFNNDAGFLRSPLSDLLTVPSSGDANQQAYQPLGYGIPPGFTLPSYPALNGQRYPAQPLNPPKPPVPMPRMPGPATMPLPGFGKPPAPMPRVPGPIKPPVPMPRVPGPIKPPVPMPAMLGKQADVLLTQADVNRGLGGAGVGAVLGAGGGLISALLLESLKNPKETQYLRKALQGAGIGALAGGGLGGIMALRKSEPRVWRLVKV